MALNFTGAVTQKQVGFGNPTSLNNLAVFTVIAWARHDGGNPSNDSQQISEKGSFPDARGLAIHTVWNDATALTTAVDRATTDATATSVTGVIDTNAWNYFAHTYEGTDGPRLFKGTLTNLVTEVSYASRVVGSGDRGDDSGGNPLQVGGRAGGGVAPNFQGDITIYMVYNSQLSLAQIQAQQFTPRPIFPGCLLFVHLGFNGTATQPDWSGNANAGTVTGATVADHVPLGRPYSLGANYAPYVSGVKRLLLLGAG